MSVTTPAPSALTFPRVSVEVFSDFICPWCYVGHRRLAAAATDLAGEVSVELVWRAFELNPELPVAGVDRRAYRSAKFGSWENSQQLDAGTVEASAQDGLEFRYDLMTRTPNTAAAHRLAWLARAAGRQQEVVEQLFRAYFAEGRDIAAAGVLNEIAAQAGLTGAGSAIASPGGEAGASVERDRQRARSVGVSSLPFHVLDSRYAFSGAVPVEEIARVLRRVVDERESTG